LPSCKALVCVCKLVTSVFCVLKRLASTSHVVLMFSTTSDKRRCKLSVSITAEPATLSENLARFWPSCKALVCLCGLAVSVFCVLMQLVTTSRATLHATLMFSITSLTLFFHGHCSSLTSPRDFVRLLGGFFHIL
jgi:hypothetical protein